jgi:hypothetical protein
MPDTNDTQDKKVIETPAEDVKDTGTTKKDFTLWNTYQHEKAVGLFYIFGRRNQTT